MTGCTSVTFEMIYFRLSSPTVSEQEPAEPSKPAKPAAKAARQESSDAKPHADTAPPPPKNESQATKLLDDLFRKTKATPCIYWLPLSEAEVRRVVELSSWITLF